MRFEITDTGDALRYQKHEELGFLYARIQTWFPFHIQIGINGREWLARQMEDGVGYRYRLPQPGVFEAVDAADGTACGGEFLLHLCSALFRQTSDEVGGSSRPFNGELKSNLKQYREGERVKFWMQAIPPSSTTRRIPPLAT
ncbi:MAG TPA: hypothetical protein VGZ73_22080, partial [Bryobacteraceae bacterium]|nr:hypothetical protein [Bryobacteraceae bacterium]